MIERNELFYIVDDIKELIGADELLEAIIRALSTDELEDVLRFIDRCYELDMFD